MNDFLDLPNSGGGKPGSGNRPNNGASDFLQENRPQTGQLPSNRPGAENRPASENRPDRLDNRQDNQGNRQDNRQDNQGNRQDSQGDRQDNRQGNQENRVDNRTDNRDNRQDNQSDRIDNRSDQRDNRQDNRQDLANNRVDRVDNVAQRQTNRVDRRVEVRQQVRQNPPRQDFWQNNRYARRWTRPYGWASWGAVSSWFPWGWSQPTQYNYGDNVYVQGDTVYNGDNAIGTQQEYGEQAYAIAASADEVAPDESADDSQWMTLGVFAMTQDDQASGPEPNLFIQLAVSKEGMIAGTYFNNGTDASQDIEGVVDRETQRTAWTVGSKDWPVMETGISNLTEDEAPALIHFADGKTQKWLLVRLEDPEGTKQQ